MRLQPGRSTGVKQAKERRVPMEEQLKQSSRRGFLGAMTALTAASYNRVLGANDRVGVGFIGFFAWHASVMTWQSLKFSDISQGVIAVPLWIPQLGYSGGLVGLRLFGTLYLQMDRVIIGAYGRRFS